HWMIWNIPGSVDYLSEGVPNNEDPVTPQGAIQAKNDNGAFGYYGPRPPAGTGVHHYHVQIFALDGPLTLKSDADLRAPVGGVEGRARRRAAARRRPAAAGGGGGGAAGGGGGGGGGGGPRVCRQRNPPHP